MPVVTKIDSQTIYINALFIQPTVYCARNCQGCYVKAFEKTNAYVGPVFNYTLLLDLLELNWYYPDTTIGNTGKTDFKVNQITLAVDTLPKDSRLAYGMVRILDMYLGFAEIYKRYKDSLGNHNSEMHITVFSPADLQMYADRLDRFDKLHNLDLISFSTLDISDISYLQQWKPLPTQINWNYQPRGPVEKQLEKIKAILPHVDSMYYIINKPDVGKHLDKRVITTYFEVLKRMRAELPSELMKKVNIDGCVVDAKRFVDFGFGCSSNISRFQIWPTGAVSGCPYAHRPSTGPGHTVTDILNNIRIAAEQYEFNRCKMPEDLHPGHPKIIERNNSHLVILED